MKSRMLIVLLVLAAFAATDANAQSVGRFGARAGLGTDINLGIAFGGGGSYVLPLQRNYVEFGVVFFGGSFDETSNNGFNEYKENTDVLVIGAMANFLFGYKPDEASTYFIAGIGLGSVNINWEEKSATDISLGTPLPGGGSMQSADGSAGGTVFNLGVGHSFPGGLNLRAELPVILAFSAPGEATAVVPTFIVTAGILF